MLRQNLSQKLLQKLSPQQIQLMKLLQIPTATLEQRIQEELEANPALDEGFQDEEEEVQGEHESESAEEDEYADEFDDAYNAAEVVNEVTTEEPDIPTTGDNELELDDYVKEYMDDDPIMYKSTAGTKDEEDKNIPFAVQSSFHEYLLEQLSTLNLKDENEVAIAEQIIGSIDNDGYLRRDLGAMVNDLLFSKNIQTSEEQIEKILKQIQQFDPVGIGSRNLQECILIQLEHLEKTSKDLSDEELKNIHIAKKLVTKYFDAFSKKHYSKLIKGLDITSERLKDVIDIITSLNPKPASGHASGNASLNYIVPDFFITNKNGELDLTLNARNAPDLRVNDYYKEMLTSYVNNKKKKKPSKEQKEAVNFIKNKIDSAKWFIDAIKQRYDTMMNTMYAIMKYQDEYFLTGDPAKLRPMILKDIAEMTGLDISTVSRVANSKYVQTEFGTKLLKEFFSESMQTEDGEEVSTYEVKNALSSIIKEENKRKPLSDEKLMIALNEKGYNIARRTVAKYREQLDIPVARMRKEL
ncbi:MAG TPA: RNA polymerase sigma-54 factor [Saprospiraceae bacterium]|nr:RNA polymerase sigma-54 factor [Saprospiraceae bacterium]